MIDRWKSAALYLSFLEHRQALAMLRQNLKQIESERDELKAILKELKDNYNPNYQVNSE
jgi:cell division protein FtsB